MADWRSDPHRPPPPSYPDLEDQDLPPPFRAAYTSRDAPDNGRWTTILFLRANWTKMLLLTKIAASSRVDPLTRESFSQLPRQDGGRCIDVPFAASSYSRFGYAWKIPIIVVSTMDVPPKSVVAPKWVGRLPLPLPLPSPYSFLFLFSLGANSYPRISCYVKQRQVSPTIPNPIFVSFLIY